MSSVSRVEAIVYMGKMAGSDFRLSSLDPKVITWLFYTKVLDCCEKEGVYLSDKKWEISPSLRDDGYWKKLEEGNISKDQKAELFQKQYDFEKRINEFKATFLPPYRDLKNNRESIFFQISGEPNSNSDYYRDKARNSGRRNNRQHFNNRPSWSRSNNSDKTPPKVEVFSKNDKVYHTCFNSIHYLAGSEKLPKMEKISDKYRWPRIGDLKYRITHMNENFNKINNNTFVAIMLLHGFKAKFYSDNISDNVGCSFNVSLKTN